MLSFDITVVGYNQNILTGVLNKYSSPHLPVGQIFIMIDGI